MTANLPGEQADEQAFLYSVEGEISFFRSIMRARPVGIHRHFHIIAIRSAIQKDTGRWVHIEAIWEKLKSCYNMDILESIEFEAEGYGSPKSDDTPVSIGSPAPSENLSMHPFFREEFNLPYEDFEALIAPRRLRATASLPSSPAPSSPSPSVKPASNRSSVAAGSTGGRSASGGSSKRVLQRGKRKANAKSKLNLAGLVGGDSDSSALTQESGDEGAAAAETPKESVVTGTDAGTEYGEDEDTEMRDASSTREASPRLTKSRASKAGAGGRKTAARSKAGGTSKSKKKQRR